MSGPLRQEDLAPEDRPPAPPEPPVVEITDSHVAQVGAFQVRRALPHRARRTVGAWCFVDHMGPTTVDEVGDIGIGPHPHLGLQTVTWLVAGEIVHHDSLGSEQLIRPGELNLMTAGRGVAHAEEGTGTYRGDLQGVQLWVAQPEATRHGAAAFEHHAELPRLDLAAGVATVLVGDVAGTRSPARHDTDHIGIDLDLRPGTTVIPVEATSEHALVVLTGAIEVDGQRVEPGHLAYLGLGRDELPFTVSEPTRALVLGGEPFPDQLLMWWNFVARTRDEIMEAWEDWQVADDRFGVVASSLDRIPVGPPPWAPRH
ncbi:MAG: Pirin domain protein [Acidimicrobiales bacterium]|nr:Pirin domain protein [Acidimicrobiales bacterium]